MAAMTTLEPTPEISEELATLIRRAELASARARLLLSENDHWRESVTQQLEYMFEIGVEFRSARRIFYPPEPMGGPFSR